METCLFNPLPFAAAAAHSFVYRSPRGGRSRICWQIWHFYGLVRISTNIEVHPDTLPAFVPQILLF